MFNENEQYEKPQNVIMSIPLIDIQVFKGRINDPNKVYDTIGEIPWDLISYPVQVSRQLIFDDSQSRGTMTIGYIDGIDSDLFTVVIFGKYADKVSTFEDIVVVPKTIINNEGKAVITSIQIGPQESFRYLTKPPRENNGGFRGNRNGGHKRFNNKYED